MRRAITRPWLPTMRPQNHLITAWELHGLTWDSQVNWAAGSGARQWEEVSGTVWKQNMTELSKSERRCTKLSAFKFSTVYSMNKCVGLFVLNTPIILLPSPLGR